MPGRQGFWFGTVDCRESRGWKPSCYQTNAFIACTLVQHLGVFLGFLEMFRGFTANKHPQFGLGNFQPNSAWSRRSLNACVILCRSKHRSEHTVRVRDTRHGLYDDPWFQVIPYDVPNPIRSWTVLKSHYRCRYTMYKRAKQGVDWIALRSFRNRTDTGSAIPVWAGLHPLRCIVPPGL